MEFDPTLPWRNIREVGFNAHIGPIRFADVSGTEWRFALELDERHRNSGGVCHGGVLMTLTDVGMGAAAFAAGGDHPCATIDFEADFLAAAQVGDTAHGAARLERRVRDLAFMSAEVFAGGRKVMRASGIWKYLSSRAPAA